MVRDETVIRKLDRYNRASAYLVPRVCQAFLIALVVEHYPALPVRPIGELQPAAIKVVFMLYSSVRKDMREGDLIIPSEVGLP